MMNSDGDDGVDCLFACVSSVLLNFLVDVRMVPTYIGIVDPYDF